MGTGRLVETRRCDRGWVKEQCLTAAAPQETPGIHAWISGFYRNRI